MKTLETDRLTIRRMSVDDAPFMLRLLNEPSWLRFIGDRGVRTLAEARRYIETGPVDSYARLGFGFCLVELREDPDRGVPIGICGLAKRDYLDDVDIGYALLPQHEGRGYAVEAARAVLAHARAELGLARIVATTRPANAGSQKVLDRLGLRFERAIRHPDDGRELLLYATGKA